MGYIVLFPVINTTAQDITRTTMVRTAVARFEFIFSMPALARIEVNAAKRADNKAYTIHIILCYYSRFSASVSLTARITRRTSSPVIPGQIGRERTWWKLLREWGKSPASRL